MHGRTHTLPRRVDTVSIGAEGERIEPGWDVQ